MSEILSQAEIEALLSSLAAEGEAEAMTPGAGGTASRLHSVRNTPAAEGRGPGKQSIVFELYDFRRPDKFSKEQLRTLQMLNETFARLAGSHLSAFLRSQVSIELISVEQVPYEEYLRSINNSVFNILSLPPLTGQAVLEIEFPLVFTMVDRMLGGPGHAINRSVLTDIERPLIRQVVERVFLGLKQSWEGVVIVNPSLEGVETSAQFVQIAPPSDIVVTILFEVKLGDARGAMSLCIPYLVLKPITNKLSAQKWFVTGNRKVTPAHRRVLCGQIARSSVECSIQLGKARLSVNEFLALRPGDTLPLERKTTDDIEMNVGSVRKFRGRPALHGKKLVFTVTGHCVE